MSLDVVVDTKGRRAGLDPAVGKGDSTQRVGESRVEFVAEGLLLTC